MGRLDGKVAVITGGAGGMGKVHAKTFTAEGAKVVIADLSTSKGKDTAEELGDQAKFIELDVTDEENWKKLVEETEEHFGPINILVNNAGIVVSKSIEDTSLEDFRQTTSINQDGVFLGMKYVFPSMKKAESGSIVNISSIAGIVGSNNNSAYTASKFAVRGLTKAAAVEFAPHNIRVNSVHPGTIRTPMTEQEDVRELVKEMEKMIPMKRIAEPIEITNLVLYLASDESSYSTGTEFVADGGLIQQM
ncbi:SDR family NAD(P)-dependent oxidoreductase [Lacicoccus alkaliphilus]|uniref:3alpha(Or 20beta)-hydroxysteroid dehydrogenase n=1 Tax=Lacicoccus alkaliphilus DSM 16010 TaxID=1123231 RepID=A0A1M7JJY4_9BACL|nr:glucose 1-dehydrogenase [Salinicoccus alkaliphilus]SHM53211.1 3alpha(or 20beta)-hydroxysteroid dehydrogenase [Salinicoccus alkaliphilus DSM 16010]